VGHKQIIGKRTNDINVNSTQICLKLWASLFTGYTVCVCACVCVCVSVWEGGDICTLDVLECHSFIAVHLFLHSG